MKFRKYILALFLLMPLFLTAAVQPAEALVRPEFTTYQVEVDSTITVPILLENAFDVYGIDVRISFDPARLEVIDADPGKTGVQIEPGPFPQPDFVAMQDADNQTGTIRYTMTQVNPTPPANGDGVLFVIQFRSKGISGETPIGIDLVEMSNRSGLLLSVQWEGADLVVEGESIVDPIILSTSIAFPTTSGSQAAPATATIQPASTSTQEQPSAAATVVPTATRVVAKTNPTAEPGAAVVQATAVVDAVAKSTIESKPEAGEPSPDISENEITTTQDPALKEDSEPQDQGNTITDPPSQGTRAATQIAQTEFSQVDSPDLTATSEPLAVIGENVTVESPVKPLGAGSDSTSSSSPLVLPFIGIVILLFVAIAVLLFLRRSS